MKKLLIITVSLLLFLSLNGLSCSLFGSKDSDDTTSTEDTTTTDSTDSTSTTSDLTNIAVTSLDDLVTTNYNLAKGKAQDWKSDAVLVNLTVKLPKSLLANQATETYIFGSAQDAVNWFSFSISESSSKYIRAIIPKEDYLGTDAKPINSSYWKMNYLKAFQLAEKNGGKTFRTANTDAEVVTTLSHTLPKGWLWWQIDYKSASTGNNLTIKVNPNDGTVVDSDSNPLSTTTTTE